MTLEQLEFAITQYLDGTLPPEELGALERRLADDAEARALLEEHRALTALLRTQPLPEMDWADVARDLSAVVTGTVSEQSRVEDQKLNALLKAAPPLPEIRWEALSQRISDAVDAEVGATDAGDDQFDEMLRAASPMPAVNWDRLANHLAGAVAAEADGDVVEAPAVIGRIGFGRKFASLAVAAVVLVATGLGLRTYWGGNHGTPGTGQQAQVAQSQSNPVETATTLVQITTPTPEDSKQPAVAEISIGPSKSYAASDVGYQRVAGSRSPVVIVTPANGERQDDWEPWLGVE
jgi:anti-sigma factor RsiW